MATNSEEWTPKGRVDNRGDQLWLWWRCGDGEATETYGDKVVGGHGRCGGVAEW